MSGSNLRSIQRQQNSAKADGAKLLLSNVQTQLVEQDALIKQLTHMAQGLKNERDFVKEQLDGAYSTLINIAYIKGWLDPESIESRFEPNTLLARYMLELIGDDERVAEAEEILKQKFLARKEKARLRLIEIEAERGCNYQLKLAEGKNLAPDGKSHSPIHEHEDGSWWLYDRRWKEEFGPFEDERAATEGCERYIKFCETGQKQLLVHSAFDAFKEKMRVEFEAAKEVARKMREEKEEKDRLDSAVADFSSNSHTSNASNEDKGVSVTADAPSDATDTPAPTVEIKVLKEAKVAPKRFKKVYGAEEEGEGK